MAIGFRASGTRLKADVSVSGSPQSINLPAGHVANDWLLMTIVTDDNTGPSSTPSGWSFLASYNPGASTTVPYSGKPHVWLYHRIDNGSLGASVSVDFNTGAWPGGDPYVLAWITAYTGVDTTAPVELVQGSSTTSTTAAQAHPQLTTAVANDWLITFRAVGADTAKTFTESVGTDVERVDDSHGSAAAPSAALYDSNLALTAGLQTQRTTTSSATVEYGSVMVSIAIKPASSASAVTVIPQTAMISFAAKAPTVTSQVGPWDLCGASGVPAYAFKIDWNADGDFNDPNEDITNDEIDTISITYGRDQERQLSPGAVGSASCRLTNASRTYSPEYAASPLSGNLDPARDAKFEVVWASTTFPLFRGKIDDYDISSDFEDRSVSFSFLDGLALLQGVKLSTGVYQSLRTGDVINVILNEAGWTGARDIDLGSTVVKFWWAEGTDALSAVQDIVKSEGPPAVAYVAPDGTFVFRDRHHRLQNTASVTSQATFAAESFDCNAPSVTGFNIAKPFKYSHGWRDIVNTVTFEVSDRAVSADVQAVWSSDDSIVLSIGQSVTIDVSGSDPFINAITPVSGTDYTFTGAGTVTVGLNRTSGASAQVTFTAIGGGVVITNMQLRAQPIPVTNTVKITRSDTASISAHGERSYPDSAPWANANDAEAIANTILLHYANRRPSVQLRVVTSDPAHFLQVVGRTISDRIHIKNDEMGIDDDFFIERVTHTIQRINQVGKPPVHSVIFGCEKVLSLSSNPFTFDVRGRGFDEGVFDPITADNASTVFIFDHPTQGKFDTGLFGT